MKIILITLLSLIVSPLFAGELSFHGASWNDVSIPLGITPYYLEVNSSETAKNVALVIEIYQQGTLVRTVRVAATGFDKEVKLDPKFALYFTPKADPKDGYKVTCASQWNEGQGSQSFDISLAELNLREGASYSNFGELKFGGDGKAPVFCLISHSTGTIVFGQTVQGILKENPGATVVVGYWIENHSDNNIRTKTFEV